MLLDGNVNPLFGCLGLNRPVTLDLKHVARELAVFPRCLR
jgi:hypothetical protein